MQKHFNINMFLDWVEIFYFSNRFYVMIILSVTKLFYNKQLFIILLIKLNLFQICYIACLLKMKFETKIKIFIDCFVIICF